MKMHNSMKFFAFLLATLFITSATQAQSDPAGPAKKDRTEGAKQKQVQRQENWQDELKLTPEQKAKIKVADDDFRTKSKASKEANRKDMEQLREERKRAHKAALSQEQAAKYDEIMSRKAAKKGDKQVRKHPKKAGKEKSKDQERSQQQQERSKKEKSGEQ